MTQTNISLRRDLVAKMKGLENQSLWQSLNSFVLTFISNTKARKYIFTFEKQSRWKYYLAVCSVYPTRKLKRHRLPTKCRTILLFGENPNV